MRKIVVVCLLLLVAAEPMHAQRGWSWLKGGAKQSQGKSKLADINISRQLNLRMEQTFHQARQTQMQLHPNYHMIIGEPLQKIVRTEELNAHQLYPEQTFLKNSTQTGKYLVARNNRLFLQEIRRMQQVWAQIDKNLPRLREEAAQTPQPENPITWLADQIPAQTNQLFIGEVHNYPEIYEAVRQLLQEVRARQPKREILLFTEFLPNNLTWTGKRPSINIVPQHYQKYFPIWDTALQAHISTIGLEDPVIMDDMCKVRYINTKGEINEQSVWVSLEGVRLRNTYWQKTLATYRAQHPEALFVIYTGADHSLYNRPFTLATSLQNTFVVALYPNQYSTLVPSGAFTSTEVIKPMSGPLERLINQLDFQRPIIKWQSADLVPIAGFDVRIKLSVKSSSIDY